MRRDIHKWFLAGIALSILATIIVCILQDAAAAMMLLLVSQGIILLVGFNLMYRRRAWREVCTGMKDERFRSHELRCRVLADDAMRRKG